MCVCVSQWVVGWDGRGRQVAICICLRRLCVYAQRSLSLCSPLSAHSLALALSLSADLSSRGCIPMRPQSQLLSFFILVFFIFIRLVFVVVVLVIVVIIIVVVVALLFLSYPVNFKQ